MYPSRTRQVFFLAAAGLLAGLVVVLHTWSFARTLVVGATEPFLSGLQWFHAAGDTRSVSSASLPRSSGTATVRDLRDITAAVAIAENRELRALLDLPAPRGWRRVAATVVARDPVSWNRRFRIGRGTDSGIESGAVVLAGGHVVGRVSEVTAKTALVCTIADPTCRLSVRLPERNATGILSGRIDQHWTGVPLCRIEYLPRDRSYEVGEPVVTSGLGGTLPEGLSVGHLIPMADGRSAETVRSVYARARVRPAASFDWFHVVAVLCPGKAPSSPGSGAPDSGPADGGGGLR